MTPSHIPVSGSGSGHPVTQAAATRTSNPAAHPSAIRHVYGMQGPAPAPGTGHFAQQGSVQPVSMAAAPITHAATAAVPTQGGLPDKITIRSVHSSSISTPVICENTLQLGPLVTAHLSPDQHRQLCDAFNAAKHEYAWCAPDQSQAGYSYIGTLADGTSAERRLSLTRLPSGHLRADITSADRQVLFVSALFDPAAPMPVAAASSTAAPAAPAAPALKSALRQTTGGARSTQDTLRKRVRFSEPSNVQKRVRVRPPSPPAAASGSASGTGAGPVITRTATGRYHIGMPHLSQPVHAYAQPAPGRVYHEVQHGHRCGLHTLNMLLMFYSHNDFTTLVSEDDLSTHIDFQVRWDNPGVPETEIQRSIGARRTLIGAGDAAAYANLNRGLSFTSIDSLQYEQTSGQVLAPGTTTFRFADLDAVPALWVTAHVTAIASDGTLVARNHTVMVVRRDAQHSDVYDPNYAQPITIAAARQGAAVQAYLDQHAVETIHGNINFGRVFDVVLPTPATLAAWQAGQAAANAAAAPPVIGRQLAVDLYQSDQAAVDVFVVFSRAEYKKTDSGKKAVALGEEAFQKKYFNTDFHKSGLQAQKFIDWYADRANQFIRHESGLPVERMDSVRALADLHNRAFWDDRYNAFMTSPLANKSVKLLSRFYLFLTEGTLSNNYSQYGKAKEKVVLAENQQPVFKAYLDGFPGKLSKAEKANERAAKHFLNFLKDGWFDQDSELLEDCRDPSGDVITDPRELARHHPEQFELAVQAFNIGVPSAGTNIGNFVEWASGMETVPARQLMRATPRIPVTDAYHNSWLSRFAEERKSDGISPDTLRNEKTGVKHFLHQLETRGVVDVYNIPILDGAGQPYHSLDALVSAGRLSDAVAGFLRYRPGIPATSRFDYTDCMKAFRDFVLTQSGQIPPESSS